MTRGRWSAKTAEHMAGRLAQHDGQCWVCDLPITRHVSQVFPGRSPGTWIHVQCKSGWSE